jgi:hypothetical protein
MANDDLYKWVRIEQFEKVPNSAVYPTFMMGDINGFYSGPGYLILDGVEKRRQELEGEIDKTIPEGDLSHLTQEVLEAVKRQSIGHADDPLTRLKKFKVMNFS